MRASSEALALGVFARLRPGSPCNIERFRRYVEPIPRWCTSPRGRHRRRRRYLRARGAELVGEVEDCEGIYRLCYVRGPEGIIIELAEQIG
jgi:catechol 2,3-dioxygenase-like lactoylglutathione lyase family enzyme